MVKKKKRKLKKKNLFLFFCFSTIILLFLAFMMDIKINNIQQMTQTQAPEQVQEANGDFKFVLTSKLEDASLAERLNLMLQDITQQGERISKKNDIKDMQRYRLLIKDFLNEVLTRSHVFSI